MAPQINSTTCAQGLFDEILDFAIYSMSPNATWEEFCPGFVNEIFNPKTAAALNASGYCSQPAIGLMNFASSSVVTGSGTYLFSSTGNQATSIQATLLVASVVLATVAILTF